MTSRSQRVLKIRNWINQYDSCFIATDTYAIRWLTGFTGSNGLLFLDQNHMTLFTDSRYENQADIELARFGAKSNCVVGPNPMRSIADLSKGKNIFIDSEKCSWAKKEEIESQIEGEIVDAHDFCFSLRGIKDKSEIDKIKTAAEITCRALDRSLAELDEQTTEKELAGKIEYYMALEGASNVAYPPIVAAGSNSALPHARPTGQRILTQDILLVDIGANYKGYCSDMTRMIPLSTMSAEQKHVSQIVLDAQRKAIEAIRPGIMAKEIDGICRDALNDKGFGDRFLHGTGHGVGLEIHEFPRINSRSEDLIQEGMVITVEPGIYLEDSFGIRWEDLFLVTDTGVEYLTNYGKLTQLDETQG